jgi:hypothetical protein
MRGCALALLLLAACGGRSPSGSVDATPDATCPIWDCQAHEGCSDGFASSTGGTDTDGWCVYEDPCGPPSGVTCGLGCDVEGVWYDSPTVDPAALCTDTPTRQIGDPCDETGQCLPTRAIVQPDGSVFQQYLQCGAGGCEAAPEPVVPDWLAPCASITAAPSPGFVGVTTSAEGLCLVQDVPGTCLATAHTITCHGDWECPQGASCDLLDGTHGDQPGTCRPGARGAPLDLGC